jgi:hypothetical protein
MTDGEQLVSCLVSQLSFTRIVQHVVHVCNCTQLPVCGMQAPINHREQVTSRFSRLHVQQRSAAVTGCYVQIAVVATTTRCT